MCITTIANLMQNSTKEGASRQYFSRDREIVPYIDSHWEYLTTMPRRVTQSWHATIQKTLMKEKGNFSWANWNKIFLSNSNFLFIGLIFVCQEPVPETMTSDCMFGLLSLELVNIRPNYEAMVRAGHLKPTDTTGGNGVFLKKCKTISPTFIYHDKIISKIAGIRGRGYKRRVPDQFGGNQRKTRNDLGTPKLPAHGYPLDHPFNKDGYRYILAEPDPHAPFRYNFVFVLFLLIEMLKMWLYFQTRVWRKQWLGRKTHSWVVVSQAKSFASSSCVAWPRSAAKSYWR